MESRVTAMKTSFFRICHICGHVSMHGQPVERCQKCGKSMAPFFYFNDQCVSIYTDNDLRPPQLTGEYRPIYGLSAFWQEEP